jgi:hypothetical protein
VLRLVASLVALSAGLGACKSQPSAAELEAENRPEFTPEQIVRERQRIEHGAVVGEGLRAPKVVVDADQLRVNGVRVAARGELTGTPPRRIEPLFQWFRGLREHFKQIRPQQQIDGAGDLTVPIDLAFDEGASLVLTFAVAEYRHLTVHAGDLSLGFETATPYLWPGPQRPATNTLELCYSGAWQARRTLRTTSLPEGATPAPASLQKWQLGQLKSASPWRATSEADVANVANELCTNGCENLMLGSSDHALAFHSALALAAAVLRAHFDRPMSVGFSSCDTAEPDAAAPHD